MEQEVAIRQADLDDINTIGFLAQQIWPQAYGGILSREQLEYMLRLIYSPVALTKQMLKQHHSFLVAELDEEPVGFASFSKIEDPGVYKLHKLYVRTDIQGKGLGKALVNAVLEEIRPLRAGALHLNVNRHNKAKSFYEKFGFRVIGEEDIDIGSGYFMNDYVMEMAL
ncbi:MAG TPA: GNAT family N-acetyltransferase [Chitinophagaceae bacterium]|jgi:GNAT superfamily N-acetyltransferase